MIVVERPDEYSGAYPAECLFADVTTTYWCTPQNPTLPVVLTLQVTAVDPKVDRIVFDTRVKGWETSAAKRITIEVASAEAPDDYTVAADLELAYDSLQHVMLARPASAARIRITMHSNHGGGYVVLQRLHVFGTAVGVGEVMLPPGTFVGAGKRRGVVLAAGYQVRWSDDAVTWEPAGELRPLAEALRPKRARRSRA